MGFRKDTFGNVWGVKAQNDVMTNAKLSIRKKNKKTGEYEDDFSDFVAFIGTSAAKKALTLSDGERIKLGDVDVSKNYVKETGKTYYNFKIFSFSTQADIDAENNLNKSIKESDLSSFSEDECPF